MQFHNKPCSWARISQPYKASSHKGIDLANFTGTPIYAVAAGTVVAASYGAWDSSYGNMVAINHGENTYTNYAHLDKILVKVGDVVEAGQLIGKMGSTGHSTGPHLHFELHLGKKWNRVDPKPYIDKAGVVTTKASPQPATVKYHVATNGSRLNVRSKPSTAADSKILGTLANKTEVSVAKFSGNWAYITKPIKGYISKTWIKKG